MDKTTKEDLKKIQPQKSDSHKWRAFFVFCKRTPCTLTNKKSRINIYEHAIAEISIKPQTGGGAPLSAFHVKIVRCRNSPFHSGVWGACVAKFGNSPPTKKRDIRKGVVVAEFAIRISEIVVSRREKAVRKSPLRCADALTRWRSLARQFNDISATFNFY